MLTGHQVDQMESIIHMLFRNQISTINLGGADGNVAANNGQDFTITINSTTVTYTVNTAAPQNDNQVVDILNGLRTQIITANLPVNAVVVGSSLRITSINGADFTLSAGGGIAPLQFGASNTTQTATNTVSIFGDPAIPGLAVDTTYNFTISTVNNVFGCNDRCHSSISYRINYYCYGISYCIN